MKIHRAATLVLMMIFSLLMLGVMAFYGFSTFNHGSLVALLTVLVVAAIAGVAFSWRQYFPRRR
ncbi:MAG TPA: hypothetical protein VMU49_03085 [Candidatus Acidoferrales bacterium]|nr:hypothetical protein [Candidatus Acidoferrales bacterium]